MVKKDSKLSSKIKKSVKKISKNKSRNKKKSVTKNVSKRKTAEVDEFEEKIRKYIRARYIIAGTWIALFIMVLISSTGL